MKANNSTTIDKMSKSNYFGYNDIDELSVIHNDVCLTFKIPVEHIQHWKKCSLIANFFGNYQAESYKENKKQIISTISTISNELLENAIKFSEKDYSDISISIKKHDSSILIQVNNISNSTNVTRLQNTLTKIKNNNIAAFQIEKINKNAAEDSSSSEIGLINIAKDFSNKIGAKITPVESTKLSIVELYVIFDDSSFLT